jgi:ferredoxin
MIAIKINNREIKVPEGTSVMKAAELAGVRIPSLCWHEELEHFTSCMVCLVKEVASGKLIPSCSRMVEKDMEIITEDEEILEGRRMALELLLSEHVGDCEAPCQIACPAHMNIPEMNRLIGESRLEDSLRVVLQDIALPSVLGRICPAPCEGACHRRSIDEAVSICLLKRWVGDEAGAKVFQSLEIPPLNAKKVAIIGAGPAGLTASFYLRLRGYACTIYEKETQTGGMIRSQIDEEKLPKEILDREIQQILQTGIALITGNEVDAALFRTLRKENQAVIIASGNISDAQKTWGFRVTASGIEVDKNTYETSEEGVFAVGSVLRSSRLAVRSAGQGKEVAFSVDQYLKGEKVTGEPRLFNSRFGKLVEQEFSEYLKESPFGKKMNRPEKETRGFEPERARKEAKRCLHCDCRKMDNCKLRNLAEAHKASQRRFLTGERRKMVKHFNHDLVVYEPGKCIKCGICVRLTAKYREKFGFTFIGRGFDVEIGTPFNEELSDSLRLIARKVAESCPTGALSLKKANEPVA